MRDTQAAVKPAASFLPKTNLTAKGCVMRLVRTLFVVVAGVALVAAVPSAQAKAKKEKKEHSVKGVVAMIDKDANKPGGTIKLTMPAHTNKKTNVTTDAQDKTFNVTDKTSFIKVVGKKSETKKKRPRSST